MPDNTVTLEDYFANRERFKQCVCRSSKKSLNSLLRMVVGNVGLDSEMLQKHIVSDRDTNHGRSSTFHKALAWILGRI